MARAGGARAGLQHRVDLCRQSLKRREHALERGTDLGTGIVGAALRGVGQGEFVAGLDGFEALDEGHVPFSLGSSLRWPDQRAGSWYSAASSRVIWPPIMARR